MLSDEAAREVDERAAPTADSNEGDLADGPASPLSRRRSVSGATEAHGSEAQNHVQQSHWQEQRGAETETRRQEQQKQQQQRHTMKAQYLAHYFDSLLRDMVLLGAALVLALAQCGYYFFFLPHDSARREHAATSLRLLTLCPCLT